jgi:UDP-glucose 4-epimerase
MRLQDTDVTNNERAGRIGVIGAGGFIGSYLLQRLCPSTDAKIRILSRNPAMARPESTELVVGDLASASDCRRFADGLEAIYYLAHRNSPIDSDLDQRNDTIQNLHPLLTLVQSIRDLKTRPRVVYFSSGGAVYGASDDHIPFQEEQVCYPVCSYGVQKLAAEHYLRIAAIHGHLSARILRVGNAFGTLLPQHRTQGLIGVALNNLVHGKPIRVFGNPDNIRDYVHLSDIADIALRVIDDNGAFSVLNVGSGEGHSVREVLRLIESCSSNPVRIEFDQESGGKLAEWAVLDITKARLELQWEPKVTLRAGIADMLRQWETVGQSQGASGNDGRH